MIEITQTKEIKWFNKYYKQNFQKNLSRELSVKDVISTEYYHMLSEQDTEIEQILEKANKSSEESKRIDTYRKLELEEDIYCITFLSFIQKRNSLIHRKLMMKSVICFTIQMILIMLLLFDQDLNLESGVVQGDLYVNFSRIICALLLHILIVPEIRTAMSMLDYASHMPFEFRGNGSVYPFILGMLKCTSGMLTEFVNVMIIIKSDSTYDILYDFVALKIIAMIDDMIGLTVGKDLSIDLNEAISSQNESYKT